MPDAYDGLTSKGARRAWRLRTRARSRTYRLAIDVLEDRTTPSTFLVTNDSDPRGALVRGSLRWAITQASLARNQGSTVEITPAVQGTITLHAGELRISSSMTIQNASGAPVTIQQETPNARVFHVTGNSLTTTVTIAGDSAASSLTLTGGQARNGNGGGILVDNSQNFLTLQYVNVTGNSAAQASNSRSGTKGNGGGIYSNGTVTLDHSSVSFNTASGPNGATGHAGGVYSAQGVTLFASHVDSNAARDAGGILNAFGSVEVVNGSTVNGNTSTGHTFTLGDLGGGGITQLNGNVVISQSQVNDNKTVGMYSGGIVILIGGVTVTDGSQVNGNANNGPGGGIAANFGGAVVVANGSQVSGNRGAGLGGGIVNFSETFGVIVADHSQVADNTLTSAQNSGVAIGGLATLGSSPSTQRSVLLGGRGNTALTAALQLFINVCRQKVPLLTQALDAFPANTTDQVGGGIATVLAGPIVVNGQSTISGNHFAQQGSGASIGDGGGLFAILGPITIDDSTISGNQATGDGGGIWNGHSLTVSNSTVTQNQAGAGGLGGGIFNAELATFTSSNTAITNNVPDNVFPPS